MEYWWEHANEMGRPPIPGKSYVLASTATGFPREIVSVLACQPRRAAGQALLRQRSAHDAAIRGAQQPPRLVSRIGRKDPSSAVPISCIVMGPAPLSVPARPWCRAGDLRTYFQAAAPKRRKSPASTPSLVKPQAHDHESRHIVLARCCDVRWLPAKCGNRGPRFRHSQVRRMCCLHGRPVFVAGRQKVR